jgi:hypothetical protein
MRQFFEKGRESSCENAARQKEIARPNVGVIPTARNLAT